MEVFGLFAACLPQASRAHAGNVPPRKRQGMVPDFMCTIPFDGPERDVLWELETLHYGTSTYLAAQDRCGAVARRALGLPAEYVCQEGAPD